MPIRSYVEQDADNARWEGFEFRTGDVVVAAPSKSGTTWTQLLVALLVFDGPVLPRSLGQVSPWMEHKVQPVAEVHRLLRAQTHRRFIKSHTPLDGIPAHADVRYVCVGRDPRDAAFSMLHHSSNLDRDRYSELIGHRSVPPRGTTEQRIDRWLDGGGFPDWSARSLFDHYVTFWSRRDEPNVALFHFHDYLRDLPGTVARLAQHLEIDISPDRAADLAAAASIEEARRRSAEIVPEAHLGIFKSSSDFLRSGTKGDGVRAMTSDQLERYDALVTELLPPDLAHWIHHGSAAAPPF